MSELPDLVQEVAECLEQHGIRARQVANKLLEDLEACRGEKEETRIGHSIGLQAPIGTRSAYAHLAGHNTARVG